MKKMSMTKKIEGRLSLIMLQLIKSKKKLSLNILRWAVVIQICS